MAITYWLRQFPTLHIDKYNNLSAWNFGHASTIIQNLSPAFLLDVQKQQEDSDKKTENKKERGIT
jgi:hypothetical protein